MVLACGTVPVCKIRAHSYTMAPTGASRRLAVTMVWYGKVTSLRTELAYEDSP